MPLRFAALLLCLAGMALAAPAPNPPESEYSRRIWRIQDGLPQNRIQALAQTPDGYLWIGTSGGLARFDGVRFTVFSRSNTPAFRDDSVLALCPGKDGSLWIGTEGGGLLHYGAGAFRAFGPGEGLTNGFVRAVKEDRKGALWVGTDRGFFHLDAGRFTRLDGRNGLPVLSVFDIHAARDGRIWGATSGSLMVSGTEGVRRFSSEAVVQPLLVLRLSHTQDGSLWLATRTGLLQLKNDALEPRPEIPRLNIQTLLGDSEGNLWVGTLDQGLIRLGRGGLTAYRAPEVLPFDAVQSLLEDREHSLWVGTQDGLVRLSMKTISVLKESDGLKDTNIISVYEDRDGTAWVASMTGQFYRVTGRGAAPVRLPVGDFRARTAFRDSKGALWLGSYNQGILRMSSGAPVSYTVRNGLRSNSIRGFCEDRRGNLWIATGSGLSRWDGKELKTYYLEDGLAYGSVRVVLEQRDGDLLAGTDGGINRVHEGKIVKDPVLAQVGSERVWSILEDSQGTVWLGTRGGGLFRIKNGKLAHYTTRDGLLSDSIYQLLEDRSGRIWMSGPAGISSVDRAGLEAIAEGKSGHVAVVPYGTAEGLESVQMNGGVQPAGAKTASGEFWFPSVRGIVRVDPNQPAAGGASPVLIENVLVDGRPIPLSGDLHIPPGRGSLEIHYTACNLLSPERSTFKYKLEGFDQTWTPATPRRTAYYTNLPPGSYRFHVATIDAAAPGNSPEASVSFIWEPHLYETAWFYALCALLSAAAGWAAFRFYARQTKARYNTLLGERVRLAREMHDTVIQGCVGISTLLEAASSLNEHSAPKIQELLDQARVQSRLTLDEARQAVWDLRHESPGGGLAGMLSALAQRLSDEKGIPVETDISGPATPLDERTERNLLLVAREAMRNAVAHGATQRIVLRLRFDIEEVRLEVADNGCGFVPSSVETGHYGLAGMRERVAQLGGSFQIRSSPGQGTTVIARVPLAGWSRRNSRTKGDHEQIREDPRNGGG